VRRPRGVASSRALSAATLRAITRFAVTAEPVAYGGQALVDGVLMRGRTHVGVAFRAKDGSIATATEALGGGVVRRALAKIPAGRGVVVLWETLALGSRWLLRSAEVSAGDEGSENSSRAFGALVLVMTLVLAIGVFNVLPAVASTLLVRALGFNSLLLERAVDGIMQMGILIGYLSLVGRSSDVDRTYRYHGAEHRAIHAYENGQALTRKNLGTWPTAHPRCGTEFLVVVILVSLVAFSLLGRLDPLATVVSRVVGIPLVAGISYEILRLLGRYRNNPIAHALAAPGLAVQRITTRQPDEAMHDVAIAALEAALVAEGAAIPAGSERPATRPLPAATKKGEAR
jgi:uncharacterized protein YqhQ